MRTKWVGILSPLLPLLAVAVFALFGLVLQSWVYLLLVIACPVVAGVLWFIYRDVDRKVSKAKREIEKSKNE